MFYQNRGLTVQEALLGPWPAQTLESGLSIGILNRKPGSQKCPWEIDRPGCDKFRVESVARVSYNYIVIHCEIEQDTTELHTI